MNDFLKPELLAPAGDSERLTAAVEFGADAVYIGSDCFGMRTAAASFGGEELKKACDYAHSKGVKVYLTCNTVPRNSELCRLEAFFKFAEQSGVDAFIITDIGVMNLARKYAPDVEIHISTQAGITNYAAAHAFYEMGAKRIVTAREISLEEIAEIRAKTPKELEIECFVHGAMCVSFSGRCLLSNYMTGRDSNRGDCAQPCRWRYSLLEEKRPGEYFPVEQDESGTYIMNSRDMCLIEHIPELAKAGIDSFKIEGRAKSAYYTAVSVNAYRCALDDYEASGFSSDYKPEQWIVDEVKKVSNRRYCTGFYFSDPMDDAQIFYEGGYVREWDVAAIADRWENGVLYASQRNRFFEGDELEIMIKGKKPFKVTVRNLKNADGEKIDNAPHPMMSLSFDCPEPVPSGAYLRMERKGSAVL
ncbi:MAG: U32 family peptidase [Clostridiaceae bacterium]|nr:U32 family peptidase [Clostridiaceae bacterium]